MACRRPSEYSEVRMEVTLPVAFFVSFWFPIQPHTSPLPQSRILLCAPTAVQPHCCYSHYRNDRNDDVTDLPH